MVKYVKGNLLDSDCDYICHQVNCQGVMRSGIAKQIRERWPEVYEGYVRFCDYVGRPDGKSLLGKVFITSHGSCKTVVNMFSQNNYGYDGNRYTSYDAFAHCLETIAERVPRGSTIGFPKNIGCGLGGGNWKVISAMIEEILGEDYDVYIYELEEAK
jgi:O-acetyl-ADP-ribose deacetylase (regulator of RNase III)